MVTGIGVDLQDCGEFHTAYLQEGDPFCSRTFSQRERSEASSRPDPARYYAVRFCAKEAVFKALAIRAERIDLSEIEILTGPSGEPLVFLSGQAAKAAEAQSVGRVLVSISHSASFVTAFAVAETNP